MTSGIPLRLQRSSGLIGSIPGVASEDEPDSDSYPLAFRAEKCADFAVLSTSAGYLELRVVFGIRRDKDRSDRVN